MRHLLGRLPFFATTGIGSLPATDALATAFECDIPYLPELPALDPREAMISAFTETRELTSWNGFLHGLEDRRFMFAKVQLAGPTTVKRALGKSAPRDDVLWDRAFTKAASMIRGIKRANPDATPLVFLDEPMFEPSPRWKDLISRLQHLGALVGIHCCANITWSDLLVLGLDVISLDARLSLSSLLSHRREWEHYLHSGATLSLGIIPTDDGAPWSVATVCDQTETSLRAAIPRSLNADVVLSKMLLTPACGLGLMTAALAKERSAQVREAQRLFSLTVARE